MANFEKFFEVARGLGDMSMLDVARYNLGVARGMSKADGFVKVAVADMATLLGWKNMRLPFEDVL